MTETTSTRLPAAARRQALVETGMRLFSAGSYRGVTTAEIARTAGVSEPILYRHFGSKRELYLACIEEAWGQLRGAVERALGEAPDGAGWLQAMAQAGRVSRPRKVLLTTLWMQALAESTEDPEIRRYLRRHMREVHVFIAGLVRGAQARGAITADRDADAEAWIFLATGLLISFAQRLGGVLRQEDMAGVFASRSEWLTGN